MTILSNLHKALAPQRSYETLTGEWHGYYMQRGKQQRVVATLTQDGDRISGRMVDIDNITVQSLYEAVADAGLPPGADEQIAKQLRQLLPGASAGPITIRTILPEGSVLEGTVTGEFVRFTKSYEGVSLHFYQIGDKGAGRAKPGHSVEYSGRLSADRKTIAGRWVIYDAHESRGFIDGGFELRRVET
jgi:hypothetical protein